MSELSNAVNSALASEYRMRGAEVHKWADPLSEEQFWKNPLSCGNSVGHLVLHLTGNLSYYIGAQIAGTGYVRNRDLEFTETRQPSKVELLRKLDETIAMVAATIERQSESRLDVAVYGRTRTGGEGSIYGVSAVRGAFLSPCGADQLFEPGIEEGVAAFFGPGVCQDQVNDNEEGFCHDPSTMKRQRARLLRSG